MLAFDSLNSGAPANPKKKSGKEEDNDRYAAQCSLKDFSR